MSKTGGSDAAFDNFGFNARCCPHIFLWYCNVGFIYAPRSRIEIQIEQTTSI